MSSLNKLTSYLIHWLHLSHPETGNKVAVRISGTTVEITCPNGKGGSSKLKKKDDSKEIPSKTSNNIYELVNYEESSNGFYTCIDGSANSYLFLKAHVCETCTEISIPVVAGILIGDCMVTLGVALVIYFGCKKKVRFPGEGGMPNGARKRGNKEAPPPVPNPDYEPIRKGQNVVYDGLLK
ncbi:T-cell surface glycoprotein CD3 epsilon chain [Rhinophrynus dorsalis]